MAALQAIAPYAANANIARMDATNPSATPTWASRTPVHIGAVGMKVRDLERVAGYYRHMLGLAVLAQGNGKISLGAGGIAFLNLEHAPDALPDDQREAGLYHTAFLMPTRADLARWILHIARTRVTISGASDHDVSEAFYLDDPEGNGVEVYADRPREKWTQDGPYIMQKTEPLDIDAIVREVDQAADYPAAPGGLRVGHVHLRVGDVAQAEGFYRDAVGLDVTRAGRQGASFLSSGGYHHHIAGNVWHSRGAGRRDENRAGIAYVALESAHADVLAATRARLQAAGSPIEAAGGGFETRDPWGTRLRFVAE